MRSHRAGATRRLVFLSGIVPVIVTVIVAISQPAFLARLDSAAYDVLLRPVPTRSPVGRVVIVDVDERSLSTIGQWPWRRDLVARLISGIREMGASIVALDIIFAEPDRYSDPFDDQPKAAARVSSDDALAATLREGRVVLGYGMTFDNAATGGSACVLHPVGLATARLPQDTGDAPYFRATGVVCSLPMLGRAAGASGFLNAAPDSDGILRRVPLIVELDGRVYPSLALAAVAAATGARDMVLRISNVNTASLTIDTRVVPVDGRSDA